MTVRKFKRQQSNSASLFNGIPTGATRDVGRLIVVGAGVAGLSAARALKENGREVLILEGRERIGGRLHTINLNGSYVDEGGAWIDGVPDNPVYQMVEQVGLTTIEMNYVDPLRVKAFDEATGRWLSRWQMLFFLWRAARVIDYFSQDSLTATHAESNLAERLEKEIEKKGRSATSKKLLRYSLRTLCDLDYAEQSELLSANALAINSDYESGSEYMIQGGYSRLVECLASDLDIRLGTTVEKNKLQRRWGRG